MVVPGASDRRMAFRKNGLVSSSRLRCALASAVCLFAALLGAPSAFAGSWPQFRYSPAHTGFNPVESTLGAANVAGLRKVCSAGIQSSYASPAVVSGRVYTAGQKMVYAVDARTCATIWSARIDSALVDTSPAVAGDLLYIGSYEPRPMLHALDPATGATVWTAPLEGSANSSPAVEEGRVFIGTSRGNLYALDAATGATLWTKSTTATNTDGTPHPVVANGVVYAAGGAAIKAFQASTGRQLWTARLFRGHY